jgi:hypothetical protein
MLRSSQYVFSGVVVAGAIIYLLESLGHMVYPLPDDIDWTDPEALGNHIAGLPGLALILALITYVVGAICGGLISSLYRRSNIWHALITGLILSMLGLLHLLVIPHPDWYVITAVLLFIPFAWLGGLLGQQLSSR